MGQIRIADLPSTTQIDGDSYVIIEKPQVGSGTYKAKVFELQKAAMVTASVTKTGDVITISIQDHSGKTTQSFTVPKAKVTTLGDKIKIEMKDSEGSYAATLTNPTAKIINRGDGTSEIIMTDRDGETRGVIVNDVQLDPEPTEGSTKLVTSGAVFEADKQLSLSIMESMDEIDSLKLRLTKLENIVARTVGLETNNPEPGPGPGPGPGPEPGPEDYRFQMNGVGYDSIQDVIADMNSSFVNYVKVNRNVSGSGFEIVGYDVEFDLGGNTWIITDLPSGSSQVIGNCYIEFGGRQANIVIKNGTLTLSSNDNVDGFIGMSASKLELDNVVLDISGRSGSMFAPICCNEGDITLTNGTNIIRRSGNSEYHVYMMYGREVLGRSTKLIIDDTSRVGVNSDILVAFYAYYGESTAFCNDAAIIAPASAATSDRIITYTRGSSSQYYWTDMESKPGYQIFRCHTYG